MVQDHLSAQFTASPTIVFSLPASSAQLPYDQYTLKISLLLLAQTGQRFARPVTKTVLFFMGDPGLGKFPWHYFGLLSLILLSIRLADSALYVGMPGS